MLPRPHRLSGEKNFELLARRGKKLRGKLLTVSTLADKPDQPTRFGIVCSLRVSKKAVIRNRLRRQISEILRLALPQITPGAMVMVQVGVEAVGKGYNEIETELHRLLLNLGLERRD